MFCRNLRSLSLRRNAPLKKLSRSPRLTKMTPFSIWIWIWKRLRHSRQTKRQWWWWQVPSKRTTMKSTGSKQKPSAKLENYSRTRDATAISRLMKGLDGTIYWSDGTRDATAISRSTRGLDGTIFWSDRDMIKLTRCLLQTDVADHLLLLLPAVL